MIPDGWMTMSNKFSDLIDLVEAKISAFPLEKRMVIVSCSGGVDSTALFHVFCELLKAKKIFSLALFHFNYGLRGEESDGDEAFCEGLAKGAGVPFLVARATETQRQERQGEGIQEWARRLRRDALKKLAVNSEFIALAHHADDAAETVVMRMMRGTSLAHVHGMSEWDGAWWRPWIRLPKSEIIAAVEEAEMLFREDSTNAQLDYARNVVRHQVLPPLFKLWPAGREKLLDLADDAESVAKYALGKALTEVDFEILHQKGAGGKTPVCDQRKLAALPDAVAVSVLAHLARSTEGGGWRQLSRTNLLKVLAAARSAEKTRFVLELGRGLYLESGSGRVKAWSASLPAG